MRVDPKIAAASAAAALAVAAPFIGSWEGLRLDPYKDLAGIPTVCYGETNVTMRRYTRAECEKMLEGAVKDTYLEAVYKAVPALRTRPWQAAASASLAYNIGTSAFANSTVARRFNAGDWRGGCEAFLMWRFVKGKEVQGLVNRRKAEMTICLEAL